VQVSFIGNVVKFEVNHFAEIGEKVGSEHKADDQRDNEELEISNLKKDYLEFLMRLSMCGYPP